MPIRIQRSRAKGWRKPEGAVIVDRTSAFGNPWSIDGARDAGFTGTDADLRARVVGMFRNGMRRGLPVVARITARLHELRGKDLVCFCPLDQPCHADVLLEMANMGDDQ